MSKSKIKSTIDYLSDSKKAVTAAVLLVLVIVAFLFVRKKIRQLVGTTSSSSIFDDPNITDSLNFSQMARRIYDATNGFGTDEDEIYSVLEMLQTQADYTRLSQVWTELYDEMGFWYNLEARSTLPGTLQSELNKKELSRARTILTDKGITPDF